VPVRDFDPGYPMYILVVDDDPAIRDISSRFLARVGFTVDVAEDGQSAWEAVRLHRYDLIITDQNMPRLSGTEFIDRLHEAGVGIPVILMTGGAVISSMQNAPDFFLTKPFAFSSLLEEVNRLLCLTSPQCLQGGGN